MLKLFYQDQDACDVNIKAAEFQKCYTPLHLAAEKGSLECLRLLLQFDEVKDHVYRMVKVKYSNI